jgi:hypothetical protein
MVYHKTVDDEERREFLKALGVGGAVAAGGVSVRELSLADLRSEVSADSSQLAETGEAIRADLAGSLDASLLTTETAALAEAVGRVQELRAAGIPASGDAELYGELTEPGWRINEHLAEVGFYEAAEEHFPLFTVEHVDETARELVASGSFASLLSPLGFDDAEQTALLANVVNNRAHLEQWLPVSAYPDDVYGVDDDSIDPETVPPLHRRAVEGALLWIDGYDWHLWQKEVILTEGILDEGAWDVRAMLAGSYLVGSAAKGLATGDVSDEELSALLTAGTAVGIVGQFDFANDVARITDDERAPRRGV